MSKAVVPIMSLKYPGSSEFSLAVAEVFEDGPDDVSGEDQFTYTIRYDVPLVARDRMQQRLREELEDKEEAERFIQLMDDNDWNVSFFVDAY